MDATRYERLIIRVIRVIEREREREREKVVPVEKEFSERG